jgi:hypothetical protein
MYDVLDSELNDVYLVVTVPSHCLAKDLVCYCLHDKVFHEKKLVLVKGFPHESA